ncbi:MAG TPA: glycosyltransferase family 4 protein [Allocoleopsis sp.]
MRITFVMPNFGLSGGDRVAAIYAQRLRNRGHEVFVIAGGNKRPRLRDQIKSVLKGKGWTTSTKIAPSHFDTLIDVPCVRLPDYRPIQDADLPDADVVIATWWETAEWVSCLSPEKGAKAYFVQHHEVFDYVPQERARATYKLPLHKIVVAEWLVQVMRSHYGDTQVSLVPNSVDTTQFNAPARGKQASPTVGMLYAPVSWKGCDISLKAFSIAAQRVPGLRLVAFGSVPPSPDLPLPAAATYIQQPNQAILKDLYARCDAWLFGSRSEGFGLPILEAMACRTPVIGTPVGAAPELLANGAGILVNPEDPEDMARAIEQVCALSEEAWQAMSDAAYLKATSYTWEDATDRFEQALKIAIERQFPEQPLEKATPVA